MAKVVRKLTVADWEELLPVRSVLLGTSMLDISPIGAEDLVIIISRMRALSGPGRSLKDIGGELLVSPEKLTEFIKVYCRDLVPELVGLDGEDFLRLPPGKIFEILEALVDVNTRGTNLLKNLNALTEKMKGITMEEVTSGLENETVN